MWIIRRKREGEIHKDAVDDELERSFENGDLGALGDVEKNDERSHTNKIKKKEQKNSTREH